jgi:hypothetical protein
MPAVQERPASGSPHSRLELSDIHGVIARHPGFTEPALRALIHRADENGLREHLYRIGRRVWIDLNGFEDWVRSKQQEARR